MAKKKAPTDRDPRWTSQVKPAPGDLRIVQAFLNTDEKSELNSPQALADWLGLWGLVAPGTALGEADLVRALEVQKALRALVAHPGKTESDAAAAHLDRTASSAMLRVRFAAGGRARLEPASGGLDGALARLCVIVMEAQIEGIWRNVKLCVGKDCRTAFFDFSRNHSGKWCSTRCVSRNTSLAYRGRNLTRVRMKDRGRVLARRTVYGR